ncbi:MAG: hypothetical protein FGM54_06165 [Chitinophagaceae bacterium]|nr:hypothetical protein [Chitinophagaceae bacterium]
MRILIMTNSSPQAEALIHACLQEGLDVQGVLIENKLMHQSAWLRIKKNIKKNISAVLLPWRVNKNTLKALRFEQQCEKEATALLTEFIGGLPKSSKREKVRSKTVASVNDAHSVAFIESVKPNLVIVYGTGIIKPTVLGLANTFVNAHSSILPFYRGSKSEFWQCYDHDFSQVGISIHAVDAGVDTGAVYAQFHQTIPVRPNPHLLRCNNLKLMLTHYPRVVSKIVRGEIEAKPLTEVSTQKAFRMKDLTEAKKVALYLTLAEAKD